MKVFQVLASVLLATSGTEALRGSRKLADAPTFEDNPAPEGGPSPEPSAYYAPVNRPSPIGSPAPSSAPTVQGCTTKLACNFNPDATSDDGTCTYAATNTLCSGECDPSFPANCVGECGGTPCCPQTCQVAESKAMLTCDEIGFQYESTGYTCNTLEANNGCDCSGCGCGFFVDEDGYEIVDGMEADYTTCDKSFKLSQPCTANSPCDAAGCKAKCEETTDCAYAASNTQAGCMLYTDCKSTRTVSAVTTTYYRRPANQGVVDDGATCACTWWTCVNDNGLGYCN